MNETPPPDSAKPLADTGIEGLNDILNGGLTPERMYLVEGDPGSGKTTLALQFLLAGVSRGERTMYVTLSETTEELADSAASHGWTLDGIDVFQLAASEDGLRADTNYTMFHPSEVELSETTRSVLNEAERIGPARLVFDSLSELRLLAQNSLRYRRQILAIKQFFARRSCTVLFVDDRTGEGGDLQLFSLAHGVISLERHSPEYGRVRRRLQIAKVRGRAFREGYHDFSIERGGLRVHPRLVAADHATTYVRQTVPSGMGPLDELLGGGLTRGTSTLFVGPAGTGKSSLATRYALSAADRGESVAFFLFDELVGTFLERSAGLGMDVRGHVAAGRMTLRQIDPAELSPGQFAHVVKDAVEQQHAQVIVIDSLNGYLNAMPSEKLLVIHLHELLTYLGHQGVTTLLIVAQHGLVNAGASTPVDTSYLADTVLLLRFYELQGEVRQAVSVIKKRTGRHERSIRELTMTSDGVEVGETLSNVRGVLSGTPVPIRPDELLPASRGSR